VTGVQENVSNICELDRLFAQIKREKGKLGFAFANAGVATYASFKKISEELGELRLQRDKSGDPLIRADVNDGP